MPPADAAAEAAALRAFESANDRAATPAERKLLRDLAARFEPAAVAAQMERDDLPGSGWGWLEAAVWEAVEAGSAFVAPRRVREILLRWERDGFPVSPDANAGPVTTAPRPMPNAADQPAPRPLTPLFTIEEAGLSNRQVWAMILTAAAEQGRIGAGELETWLRPAALIGRAGNTLIVGAPNAVARERLVSRLLPALHDAVSAAIGIALAVDVVLADEWLGEDTAETERQEG